MCLTGITGGIGTGKTTALTALRSLGESVVDADDIVHGLYREDEILRGLLSSRWGTRVLDGQSINRAEVARVVFSDSAERLWLNSIVHPLVREALLKRRGERNVYCGVPLLFEVGWHIDMDWTVTVWCSKETQRQRLQARGWDDQQIADRLKAQMSTEEKLELSDFGIINCGSLAVLEEQCRSLRDNISARTEK